MFHVIHWK